MSSNLSQWGGGLHAVLLTSAEELKLIYHTGTELTYDRAFMWIVLVEEAVL